MSSQESITKLWLVIPVPFFIFFVFILIIPGNAILISNNNYFGITSNSAYGQQQPNQMNSNNITD
jgi:hypothetical protein